MLQWGLVFAGPPGWAAAIAITAMIAVAGVMAAEEMEQGDDETPRYGIGGVGHGNPSVTTITVPSYSEDDVEDFYGGGE